MQEHQDNNDRKDSNERNPKNILLDNIFIFIGIVIFSISLFLSLYATSINIIIMILRGVSLLLCIVGFNKTKELEDNNEQILMRIISIATIILIAIYFVFDIFFVIRHFI